MPTEPQKSRRAIVALVAAALLVGTVATLAIAEDNSGQDKTVLTNGPTR